LLDVSMDCVRESERLSIFFKYSALSTTFNSLDFSSVNIKQKKLFYKKKDYQ